MKSLNALLPTRLDLAVSEQPSDCLTDDEKQQALAFARKQVRDKLRYKLKQRGMKSGDIEFRMSEMTDEVVNDMIDEAEVIRSANFRKFIQQQDEADRVAKAEEREKQRAELVKACDANYFYNKIRRHFLAKHGEFHFDDTNRDFIKAICFFFACDPRFETEFLDVDGNPKYSLNRGLAIVGTAGQGKTEVIKAISDNPINPVMIFSMLAITDQVRANGDLTIDTHQTLLLDDVGTEEPAVKHYGSTVTWFKDFIESYYMESNSFRKLIITTNCDGDETQQRYGYRVRSRMRQMFNFIEINGNDRRK